MLVEESQMNNFNEKQLESLLFRGLFSEAEHYIEETAINFYILEGVLQNYAMSEDQLSVYAFERYMFDKTVDEKWHDAICGLVYVGLCWIEDRRNKR